MQSNMSVYHMRVIFHERGNIIWRKTYRLKSEDLRHHQLDTLFMLLGICFLTQMTSGKLMPWHSKCYCPAFIHDMEEIRI